MQPGRTRALALIVLAATAAATLAADGDEAVGVHAAIRCAGCHDRSNAFASADAPVATAATDTRAERCRDCHGNMSGPDRADDPFHARAGRSCLQCHSFHEPTALRIGDQVVAMNLSDATTRDHCRGCHRPGADLSRLDDGHRAAAAVVYHGGRFDLAALSPSDGCLLCHERGRSDVSLPADVPPAPRFHTGASHAYGIPVVPGQGSGPRRIRDPIDPRLTLPGGRMECLTCHQLTGGAHSLLVPFEDPYAMCLGCHQVRQQDPLTVAATR